MQTYRLHFRRSDGSTGLTALITSSEDEARSLFTSLYVGSTVVRSWLVRN